MGDVSVRPAGWLGLALGAVALAAGARALAGPDDPAAAPARPAEAPGAAADGGLAPAVRIDVAAPARSPAALSALAPVIESRGGAAWRSQPAVAAPARQAAEALTGQPLEVRAWGDPEQGCFVLAARVDGGGAELHRALREALEGPAPGAGLPGDAAAAAAGPDPARGALITDGWELHEAGPRVSSRFTVATETVRGEVRVLSRGTDRAAVTWAIACAYSIEREPARSARVCDRLLPAIEEALHTDLEGTP